jgi:hypothetical protein
MHTVRFALGCAAFGAVALASPALAAPEEIQVYMDELNARGEVGLDVHVNNVLRGDGATDYPGAQSSLHRTRITPEFSLGLGSGFELGAYLPLATLGPDATPRVDGWKMRLKWLAPRKEEGFYWGANWELGRVGHALDINPWNSEVKLIGGWRRGKWVVGANANIDFVVSGPQPSPASLEIATKLGYKLTPRLMLGVENYNGMGEFKSLGHLPANEHGTYLVADASIGRWDVNFGIGKGYGANADHLVMKMVIGVPIGRKKVD